MDKIRLKVSLTRIEPLIWRRLDVPADICLEELHVLIQAAMGWEDAHPFSFHLRPPGSRSLKFHRWKELNVESRKALGSWLKKRGDLLAYEYDFGDSWVHHVAFEERLESSEKDVIPKCIDGERACPLEDCGGPGRYTYLLEVFSDPSHPDREEMLDWLDEDFESEFFDIADANDRIADWWDQRQ